MAYIIFRKITDKPWKKRWIPVNRKYKWMFWLSFFINISLIISLIYLHK